MPRRGLGHGGWRSLSCRARYARLRGRTCRYNNQGAFSAQITMENTPVQSSLEASRAAEATILRVRLITVFIGTAIAFSLPDSHPAWVKPAAIAFWLVGTLIAYYINGRTKSEPVIRWTARALLVVDFI